MIHFFTFIFAIIMLCLGIRIINPKTPTIINGGTMQLIGPCFNGSVEPITCVFTDKDGDVTSFVDENGLEKFKQIKGITVNQKAICPIPLFRRLGSHNVTITITSNNGVFSTAFEVGKQNCCEHS